jgi:molecular chaperone GrpE
MSEDKSLEIEINEDDIEVVPETESEPDEPSDAETVKPEEDAVAEELAQLKAEYEERYDRMLRTIADYENSKKRAEREKEEFLKYAVEGFVKELIPTLDSIRRAIESTTESKDFDSLSEGVQLIHKQLLDLLDKRGVMPIEAVGEPFDPTLHEAIMHIESDDVPENAVIQEFQRGYTLHGRVIRPSMVSVSKGQAEKVDEPSVFEEQADISSDSDVAEKEAGNE